MNSNSPHLRLRLVAPFALIGAATCLPATADAEVFITHKTKQCGWLLTERELQAPAPTEPKTDDWYAISVHGTHDFPKCARILDAAGYESAVKDPCDTLNNGLKHHPEIFVKPFCEDWNLTYVDHIPTRKMRPFYKLPEFKKFVVLILALTLTLGITLARVLPKSD